MMLFDLQKCRSEPYCSVCRTSTARGSAGNAVAFAAFLLVARTSRPSHQLPADACSDALPGEVLSGDKCRPQAGTAAQRRSTALDTIARRVREVVPSLPTHEPWRGGDSVAAAAGRSGTAWLGLVSLPHKRLHLDPIRGRQHLGATSCWAEPSRGPLTTTAACARHTSPKRAPPLAHAIRWGEGGAEREELRLHPPRLSFS